MQIELAGLVMQGMHHQGANPDVPGQTDGSQNRILQQISASITNKLNPFALCRKLLINASRAAYAQLQLFQAAA